MANNAMTRTKRINNQAYIRGNVITKENVVEEMNKPYRTVDARIIRNREKYPFQEKKKKSGKDLCGDIVGHSVCGNLYHSYCIDYYQLLYVPDRD